MKIVKPDSNFECYDGGKRFREMEDNSPHGFYNSNFVFYEPAAIRPDLRSFKCNSGDL